MDATKISFCNHNGFSIQNNRIKSDIINNIKKFYKLDIYNLDYRIYSDHIVNYIKTNSHVLACLITTGRPYIMYLTKILNENVCLLIDLKIKLGQIPNIISVPLSCDEELFNDTIILGDLFKNNNNNYKWEFHIEKTIVFNSKLIKNNNQLFNLKISKEFLGKINTDIMTPFNIKLKNFTDLPNIKNLIQKYNNQTVGVKIYGLKNPIHYYFNKRYIPNNKMNNVKLIKYNCENTFCIEKKELRDSFNNISNTTKNDTNTWIEIIENNIDVEKSFILTLKKSDTYGIFDIYSQNNKIGISRIVTIELHNELIQLFKEKCSIKVKAIYNFKFNKWEVEDIIDFKLEDNNIEDINKHVDMLSKLSKPNYLEQNC